MIAPGHGEVQAAPLRVLDQTDSTNAEARRLAEAGERGPVWIVRPVGGHPQKYSKKRVTLKDKMELKPEQAPAPSTESKPAPDNVDKKKKKN